MAWVSGDQPIAWRCVHITVASVLLCLHKGSQGAVWVLHKCKSHKQIVCAIVAKAAKGLHEHKCKARWCEATPHMACTACRTPAS